MARELLLSQSSGGEGRSFRSSRRECSSRGGLCQATLYQIERGASSEIGRGARWDASVGRIRLRGRLVANSLCLFLHTYGMEVAGPFVPRQGVPNGRRRVAREK